MNDLDTKCWKGAGMTIGEIPPIVTVEEKEIVGCSNAECQNSIKNIGHNFCPECGSKTEECFIDVTHKEDVTLYDIMEKLDIWDVVFAPEYIKDEINDGNKQIWLANRHNTETIEQFKSEPESKKLLNYLDTENIEYNLLDFDDQVTY